MLKPRLPTVAVIGLGAFGLVATKNLVEEGFDVTAFDRNPYIGGLWRYTTDNRTSVLPSTVANVSKERGCFTDFPFPLSGSDFPCAREVIEYLEAYADHFNLRSRFRLNTSIKRIRRDRRKHGWRIVLEGTGEVLFFDKVVISTGVNNIPSIPKIKGVQKFRGERIHSQDYKWHIPRYVDGKPFDHVLTLRFERLRATCEKLFPELTARFFDRFAQDMQDRSFTIKPEWGLSPAPSLKFSIPVIADSLIEHLEAGNMESVSGVSEFVGPDRVLLDDGKVLEVDAVIWCTGYQADFSCLDRCIDPTAGDTSAWDQLPGSRSRPLPRLYQNIFSLQYPDSLAFIGYVALPAPAFLTHDLASMALAQVWKGNSKLPSRKKMEKAVDDHQQWICDLARRGRTHPAWVNWPQWTAWVNEAAGTGLKDHLGWGLKGWNFWRRDRKLCGLLMDGMYSPHVFRLFETGKRTPWEAARETILEVNERVAARSARMK